MSIDGILNINKPPGKTSFELVSLVRRLSGERKVGHAGTLDPTATGILLVCLGQGTRVVEFMAEASKVYRAEIELGAGTDTYDACGKVTQIGDISHITRGHLEEALGLFQGVIEQTPPMYSAIKHQGKRLYQLARSGIEVARKPKRVCFFRLELLDWQPPVATIEVECSAGTYIRSLAHDLGVSLGCGAHLKELVRLRCGPFDIAEAIPLPTLEEAFRQGYWTDFLYPIDEALLHWDAAIVSEADESCIRNGRSPSLGQGADSCCPKQRCRAYSSEGDLLAVLSWRPDENRWHPDKVFKSPPPKPLTIQ